MALRDEEQRTLTEIERHLVEEDPKLANQFAGHSSTRSLMIVTTGVVVTFAAGIAVLITGIQLASPLLVLVGVIFTMAFPALTGWALSSRRRGRSSK